MPSVYRRRATPISDSDFEQPDHCIVCMPSKKNQLLLMKKFQSSRHITRQAAPSPEDKIQLDLADPFFNRSITPSFGPSAITVNDIFTLSPVYSARVLSPFAGNRSIFPSTSRPGKEKAKANTNFTARIPSLVSSLLLDNSKKQRPPTPRLPLGQQKRSLSQSVGDHQATGSVRIISRRNSAPTSNELTKCELRIADCKDNSLPWL